MSSSERRDPDIVRREDGTTFLDGLIPIDLFGDLFHLQKLPGKTRTTTKPWGIRSIFTRPYPHRRR